MHRKKKEVDNLHRKTKKMKLFNQKQNEITKI